MALLETAPTRSLPFSLSRMQWIRGGINSTLVVSLAVMTFSNSFFHLLPTFLPEARSFRTVSVRWSQRSLYPAERESRNTGHPRRPVQNRRYSADRSSYSADALILRVKIGAKPYVRSMLRSTSAWMYQPYRWSWPLISYADLKLQIPVRRQRAKPSVLQRGPAEP